MATKQPLAAIVLGATLFALPKICDTGCVSTYLDKQFKAVVYRGKIYSEEKLPEKECDGTCEYEIAENTNYSKVY